MENDGLRRSGVAAKMGGLLWMLHYGLHLGFGMTTGQRLTQAGETLHGSLDTIAYFGACIALGLALLGLSRSLSSHQRGWGVAGAVFALTAMAAGVAGVGAAFGLISNAGTVGSVAGTVGILGLFLSAVFTGNGLLRAGAAPPWVSLAVVYFGWLTLPASRMLLPFEAVLPTYTVAKLHFAVAGALWIALGSALAPPSRQASRLPIPEAAFDAGAAASYRR